MNAAERFVTHNGSTKNEALHGNEEESQTASSEEEKKDGENSNVDDEEEDDRKMVTIVKRRNSLIHANSNANDMVFFVQKQGDNN